MYSNYVNAPSKRAAFCSIVTPILIALTITTLALVYFLFDYASREEVRHCFITRDNDTFAWFNHSNVFRDLDEDKETHYILFRGQNMSHFPRDAPIYAGRMSRANFDCSQAKGVRDAPGSHIEIYGNFSLGEFHRTTRRPTYTSWYLGNSAYSPTLGTAGNRDCWEKFHKESPFHDWNRPSEGDYGATRVALSSSPGSYTWNKTEFRQEDFDKAEEVWMEANKEWAEKVFEICYPEGTGAENECCANWVVQTSMFKTFGTLGGIFFLVKVVFDLIYLAITGGSKVRVNAYSLQLENKAIKGMQPKVIAVQPSPLA